MMENKDKLESVAKKSQVINIRLFLNNTIEPEKIDALKMLMYFIIPYTNIGESNREIEIIVTEKNKIPDLITSIQNEICGDGRRYRPDIVPDGITVPLEKNGGFFVVIYLSKELIEQLTKNHFQKFEIVSTVLEEFLHLSNFYRIWDKYKALNSEKMRLSPCRCDLNTISGIIIDEYCVNRNKSELFQGNCLFKVDENSELVPGKISLPFDISIKIKEAYFQLKRIVIAASKGYFSADEAWDKITWIFHKLFYDLSHDAAYKDSDSSFNIDSHAIKESFFENEIKEFWGVIHEDLKKQYSNHPEGYFETVSKVSKSFELFLNRIGIFIELENMNFCKIHFSNIYFHE